MEAFHALPSPPPAPSGDDRATRHSRASHGAATRDFLPEYVTSLYSTSNDDIESQDQDVYILQQPSQYHHTVGHGNNASGFLPRRSGRRTSDTDSGPRQTRHSRSRPEPLKLPTFLLGAHANNSYFARRLRRTMYIVSFFCAIGMWSFWVNKKSISDGGVYVDSIFTSLSFQTEDCPEGSDPSCGSCSTIAVYAMLVYCMLPVVVMIGLPATGIRLFEPFKRQERHEDPTAAAEGKRKVTRTIYMQICEILCSWILLFDILVFWYFVYSLVQGNNFDCSIARVQLYMFGAIITFSGVILEIVYFARFREHVKMQLGAFLEAQQTGRQHPLTSRMQNRIKSQRASIISDIRRRLIEETELGNMHEIEEIILEAKSYLGEDFAADIYRDASITCWLFGKSMKNPLHIAAFSGNIPVMGLLVRAGFSVNSLDKVKRVRFSTGDLFWYFARHVISKPPTFADKSTSIFRTTLVTPLHCAVATGQTNAVRWLLDHGADPNAKAKSSYRGERIPPLFAADSSEIVKMLLEAGANHLTIPDPGRMNTLTVLQLAYLRGNIPVAREIEKWGGDVALTPLHEAAAANDVSAVRKLLRKGADPNCLGEHGYCGLYRRTPLHWAAINGAVDAVEILLEACADPNFQDSQGRSPLHWAARMNRVDVVKVLLEKGADPHLRDDADMTPLLCAAKAKDASESLFDCLVQHGADINEQLPNGDTGLHLAMKDELQNTALAILAAGGDVMRTNHDGYRPVDCTTSTTLQFEIKRAAGNRDVMISYTHSHSEFALKLRESLERANVTTWLDLMDPSGIGGGSVWREEIARGIKNAAMVVCILTEDYTRSEWCLKELAYAKETGTPIMAISTEHVAVTEDLQVYLYTRQMVPFEPAITSVIQSDPLDIRYTYNEDRYVSQFRLLLDGVRDEIEKQRTKHVAMRGHRRHLNRSHSSTTYDVIGVGWDVASLEDNFVFITHNEKHPSFAQRIYDRLTENGIDCVLDGAQSYEDMADRIYAAKEAIARCSTFIVVLSSKTVSSETLKDQLAFAEDKGKPILPIMLNDMEIGLDKHYTLSRGELFHFTPELGFTASFSNLLGSVQHIISFAIECLLAIPPQPDNDCDEDFKPDDDMGDDLGDESNERHSTDWRLYAPGEEKRMFRTEKPANKMVQSANLSVVADLVDSNASTKHVTAFLSERLGRNISSQQARNIIRKMHGRNSAESRLRDLLYAYAQHDENDVLLLQDQMDITCAIVVQSAAQKHCFAKWGNCLVMDWTHGTNNLGYHMGSLVVTSPTGRGIPALDFFALDEQAQTLWHIFEFFKSKNSAWDCIQTFVIDKDFVEWDALEKCFPKSKVLLSQFHAITYWMKLLQKSKYNLKIIQREEILAMLMEMIYSSSERLFGASYQRFSEHCMTECPLVLDYFGRNWKSCVDMWCNYARGSYFSAGNTTTNRIEANWNQLKMLLGRKPRIDKTVAGILAHQVAVLRQFNSMLRLRSSSQAQDGAKFANLAPEQPWKWKVTTTSSTYVCDDICWVCSCMFSRSTRLPCKHLILLAMKKESVDFPSTAIPLRWRMDAAVESHKLLPDNVESIPPVLSIAKVKWCPTDNDTKATNDAEKATFAFLKKSLKQKQVAHVRRERANLVVLSSAEKYSYAKAAFDPLMDHLSQLSTVNFFTDLEQWQNVVRDAINDMAPVTSDTIAAPLKADGAESESESESDAIPDAAEIFSVADAVQNHEGEYVSGTRNRTEMRYLTDNFSQVSLPTLELSENSQRILNSTKNKEELQAPTSDAQPGHGILDLEPVLDQQLNTENNDLEELDI
ncbi:Ankyrin-like protein, partial [Globisporangium splendens]